MQSALPNRHPMAAAQNKIRKRLHGSPRQEFRAGPTPMSRSGAEAWAVLLAHARRERRRPRACARRPASDTAWQALSRGTLGAWLLQADGARRTLFCSRPSQHRGNWIWVRRPQDSGLAEHSCSSDLVQTGPGRGSAAAGTSTSTRREGKGERATATAYRGRRWHGEGPRGPAMSGLSCCRGRWSARRASTGGGLHEGPAMYNSV
jgi:hypothetical protein